MDHERFEIWEERNEVTKTDWRAMMVNYIGNFPTREAAQKVVDSAIAERKRLGLK